jgi:uncharacterized SAM-binding protein YcdF (DUF218 family)
MTAIGRTSGSSGRNSVVRAIKLLLTLVGTISLLFVAGFVVFAITIAHLAPVEEARGDGIVVLTGGEHRVVEAARLLSAGKARRLLISGVNRHTRRDDLKRLTGISSDFFDCCVDIGYAAVDTSGNADETREWAEAWRFSKLIIVTSSYHMPRSLTELGRALPDIDLVPYPVVSSNFHLESWWQHPATARLLFHEYMKFLPSAARFSAAWLLRPRDAHSCRDPGSKGIIANTHDANRSESLSWRCFDQSCSQPCSM